MDYKTDFGEPFRNDNVQIVDRENARCILQVERVVACANALAGIPTEQLPEVKKAWIYCNSMLPSGVLDEFIKQLVEHRKEGQDIGKGGYLNALIDSL